MNVSVSSDDDDYDDDDDDNDNDRSECDSFQEEILLMSRRFRRKYRKPRKFSIRKQFLKLTEVCLKFESIFSQIVNVEWGFVGVSNPIS